MVLITTIKNIFIIQAIKHMPWRNCSHVKVISVDEYSLLDSDFDAHCFRDEQTLLLLVFPDNDLAACVRSLRFLNQWSEKKHLNIPCLVWGDGVMGINIGMPTIPWKLTKDEFCFFIDGYLYNWRYSKYNRVNRKASFIEQSLTPREHCGFLYTREGKDIAWISNALGISSKTVWTHRRRVMDKLGVRRLHQLMSIPLSLINKIYKVIWNHTTQKWDVVSELTGCRKKCKSTCLGIALSAIVLGGAMVINCNSAIADVSLAPDWRPPTNNSGNGSATVSGKTEYITGPNIVQSGGSGLIWMTIEQGILNGYTTGDDLSGLIYVNTGEKTETIKVWDDATGSFKTLQVFDNNAFSQRDAGTGGDENIPGFSGTADFFNATRFVTAENGGGSHPECRCDFSR